MPSSKAARALSHVSRLESERGPTRLGSLGPGHGGIPAPDARFGDNAMVKTEPENRGPPASRRR